jgi:hypothetical protein
MSSNPSIKSILLLALVLPFAILTGFGVFLFWAYSTPTVLLYVALSFVGLGCSYILYKGFKQREISLAFAKVIIIMLVVGSIFMYGSIYDLGNRVAVLEKPELHEIDWQYAWGRLNTYYDNTSVSGYIFNSGSYPANVSIAFYVFSWNNTLILTKELPVGVIDGKSYASFSTSLIYLSALAGSGRMVSYTFIID